MSYNKSIIKDIARDVAGGGIIGGSIGAGLGYLEAKKYAKQPNETEEEFKRRSRRAKLAGVASGALLGAGVGAGAATLFGSGTYKSLQDDLKAEGDRLAGEREKRRQQRQAQWEKERQERWDREAKSDQEWYKQWGWTGGAGGPKGRPNESSHYSAILSDNGKQEAMSFFGIHANDSQEAIKKKVRSKVLNNHPDRGGDVDSMKMVNKHRDILKSLGIIKNAHFAKHANKKPKLDVVNPFTAAKLKRNIDRYGEEESIDKYRDRIEAQRKKDIRERIGRGALYLGTGGAIAAAAGAAAYNRGARNLLIKDMGEGTYNPRFKHLGQWAVGGGLAGAGLGAALYGGSAYLSDIPKRDQMEAVFESYKRKGK